MRRREFVTLIGGAAAAWPLAARAQQPDLMRRIAVLMGTAATDIDRGYVAKLSTRLEELGWKDGRNIRTDLRWWTDGPEQMQPIITDMLASSPDVTVVFSNLALDVLKPLMGNVPVVFVGVGDPVGSGFVASLPRPGGNITGFASHEASMGGKWLELLKETAPRLTRILAIVHPETPIHRAFWRSIQDAAPRLGVQVMSGEVHDGAEIEGAILSFAEKENSGLVALPHALTLVHRDLIVALALRHRLPTVYAAAGSVEAGGLVSYGVDFEERFRRVAEYVDRILRGEKPADLPVQQPNVFKLGFNLRTARIIGLEIPPLLLARADEVIE